MTRHTQLPGNGPFRVYEFGPHMMGRYDFRGSPATGRTLVALSGEGFGVNGSGRFA